MAELGELLHRGAETPRVRLDLDESAVAASRGLSGLLRQHWQLIFALIMATIEITALFVGYKLSGPTAISDLHLARRVISVWYVGAYIIAVGVSGLYRRPYTASVRSQFRRCLKGHAIAVLLLTVPILLFFGPRRAVEIAVTLTLIFLPALLVARVATLLLRHAMLARNWFLDRAVVLLDELERPAPPTWTADLRKVGYDVAEVVRCKSTLALSHAELGRLIEQTGARCIIVPSPRYFGSTLDPIITFARRHGLTVRIFSPEVQRVLSTAKVDDAAGVTVEAPVRRPVIALQRIAKRTFDMSAASLLLFLTSPVLLIVSIAIKLESKGPVLFRQPRSSSPGQRECLVFKFRSMHVDASVEGRRRLDAANESSGALFKIRNDPRVTQVGRVIRKLSIDELPQLLNVLRGDMSLVGPRPLPNDDFLKVVGSEIEACYHRRSWVKPGLTGLWQISGRSHLGFMEMVLLDLYYAEHETIFLDLWIILNTVPVVLLGRGAY